MRAIHLVVVGLSTILTVSAPAEPQATQTVPFVGCPGALQGEPFAARKGKPLALPLPRSISRQLAVYVGLEGVILGPRGLECDSDHGTQSGWLSIGGEGGSIEIRDFLSGTNPEVDSEADAFTRRYIPKLVSDEQLHRSGDDPAKAYFYVPYYPRDILKYRGAGVVEFFTPPHRLGLGTDYVPKHRDQRSSEHGHKYPVPTYGVLVKSGDDSGVTLVTVRLSPKLNYLHSTILKYFERCLLNAKFASASSFCKLSTDSD